ncbi:MAG: glycoside hydrolase family 25 protein [Eubacterium sp.]|jgi:GH25 family lysozyme M1 (1,4-beta-N-acetylmuramidase)|nr:glycoside hydrolase family 25 protein [Eubacterium sp.]
MFKKIFYIGLAAVLSLGFCVFPISAKIISWDGTGELIPGNTYYITEELTIRSDLTIPKGVKLGVREGGTLIVRNDDIQVIVMGNLTVSNGGLLELRRGALNIVSGGSFHVYGQYMQFLNTQMKVSGNFTSFNQSEIKTSGGITVYTSGTTLIRGKFTETSAGVIGISGTVTIDKPSETRYEGAVSVTLSGSMTNLGYISIGHSGNFINSGSVVMKRGSNYTRFGSFVNTKSAVFTDNREKFEYEAMTVAILADEPAVEIRGIDVSYVQGEIDWEKVSQSDAEFAIIRAGRGAVDGKPMKEDDYFRKNIEGATSNGLDVGVYFYSYANTIEEARQEAEFFVGLIDGYEITYPVILDMEEEIEDLNVGQATEMVEAFFEVLMENNYFPMLYSFKSWFETYLDMKVLDNYAIWLAQLGEVTYQGGYYIWQYSHTGKVNGIKGDVLLDISYIDFPSLLRRYNLNNL